MPFFSPKTWKQRIVEFPGRRRLDDTSAADVYDVSRAEGTVMQEGDGFTATNMNNLEQRIKSAMDQVETSISSLNSSMSKIIGITGDLNDIREFSYGYATTNAINKPVSRNGYVETLPSSGESASIILQRYTPYMQNSIYIRWCESGAWSEWTLVDNS